VFIEKEKSYQGKKGTKKEVAKSELTRMKSAVISRVGVTTKGKEGTSEIKKQKKKKNF